MILNDAQRKCIYALEKHRMILITKDRQQGITTMLLSHALNLSVEKINHMAMFVCVNEALKRHCQSVVRSMMLNCPGILCKSGKSSCMQFSNGSAIRFTTSREILKCGRSLNHDLIIIDEGAYMDELQDVTTCVIPTLMHGNGQFIIASTPSHEDHYFTKLCKDASSGEKKNDSMFNLVNTMCS